MKELLKRTKVNIIISSIITILFGIILIVWPTSSTLFISSLAGWLLFLGGIISVVIYFSTRQTEPKANLLLGLIVVSFGFWAVIRPSALVQLISVLFGVILLLHGFLNIDDSLELKNGGITNWWVFLFFSILTIILGIFIIWSPIASATVMTIISGISLLFDGITDLILVFRISHILKSPHDDYTF